MDKRDHLRVAGRIPNDIAGHSPSVPEPARARIGTPQRGSRLRVRFTVRTERLPCARASSDVQHGLRRQGCLTSDSNTTLGPVSLYGIMQLLRIGSPWTVAAVNAESMQTESAIPTGVSRRTGSAVVEREPAPG